jgi:DNA invertase Pin-like site-specific DNA recombinase
VSPDDTGRAVLYARVSTAEQADSDLGLAAQRERLASEAERRGWADVEVVEDAGVSGSLDAEDRPALAPALAEMRPGDVLVVAKLDRLSRSVLDFARILGRAQEGGWSVAALDLGVDTTSANGELVAHMVIAIAQWERRMIGERTSAALAQSEKRLGRRPGLPPVGGGKPRPVPPELRAAVEAQREGKTLRALADALNAQGHRSLRGKRWHATSVKRLLDSLDAAPASA